MSSPPATSVASTSDLLSELLTRCRFPPANESVTCAVSGGADSLALLALARGAGLSVTAVHVDHGLRPDSESEAGVVGAVAEQLGAGFRSTRVSVPPGPNLEARARLARYRALPPGVLTGHTADDQAETILVNLLRGAGLDGLSGMARTRGQVDGARTRGQVDGARTRGQVDGARTQAPRQVSRPLLDLRRAETRRLCTELGIVVVEDPSNHDRRFVRNRIRHELLPLMAEVSGRDPVPVLARQAEMLGAEADLLDELAAAIDPIDAKALAAADPVLARRAVRRWLSDESTDDEYHPPSSAEVARVLAVARGESVGCQLAGGRSVRRSGGRLLFTASGTHAGPR